MRRFWVPKNQVSSESVTFEGDSYKHLIRVSRKSVGDQVEVIFGEDHSLLVELTEVSKKQAVAKVLGRRELPELPKPHLQLAFCLPKPNVFENVLEKSVELGVAEVQPLFNENSFFKAVGDIKDSKWQRWEKIIESATTQSIRAEKMQIGTPVSLEEFAQKINRDDKVLGLFFYEGESANPVQSYLNSLDFSTYERICVIVGSEGGFSEAEVTLLEENGLKPITVGPQILRAETACVAIMSVIKYQAGQMGEKKT